MLHINIGLNHIKNLGYTKHFTDEDAKLNSFTIRNSEEVVELKFTNRQNKKLERTVSYEFIEELMEIVLLGKRIETKEELKISPNVDQLRSKQKTNVTNETPIIKPEKMEKDEPNILNNLKKVNKILFQTLGDLEDAEIGAVPAIINRSKAIAQNSQVIINSAKVELDYLKRFGNGKS